MRQRTPVLEQGEMVAIPTARGLEHGRIVGAAHGGIVVRYDSVESNRVVLVTGEVRFIPRARLPRHRRIERSE